MIKTIICFMCFGIGTYLIAVGIIAIISNSFFANIETAKGITFLFVSGLVFVGVHIYLKRRLD